MASVIIDVNINAEDAAKKAKELANSIKAIKDEQKALKASGDENSASYVQNAQMLRTLQAEQKSYLQLSQSEIGSNNQLRAQLALVTQQYNSLSKEERDNTLQGKAFQTQIRAISDELKVNEKAVGDNRRNVGNYRDTFKSAGQEIVGAVPGLSQYTDGLGSLSGVIKPAITGLQGFKFALAATGIGLIIPLIASLVAYFASTEKGAEQLERGIAGLKGAFQAFITPLTKVGEFLVNIFTNPMQALKDFKSLLSGNILDNVKKFGETVKEGFNQGVNIKTLEQNAEDAGRELNKQASKLRADAAVLRAKGDADSLKQAESFYKKADQLTQQSIGNEIKAQQSLIKMKEKNGQARDEDYNKLNDLYAKIDQSRQTDAAKAEKLNARQEKLNEAATKKREESNQKLQAADQARLDSETNIANLIVGVRQKEINDINHDIDEKVVKYKQFGRTTETLERERVARLQAVRRQFEVEDLQKIIEYNELIISETNKTIDLEIANIQDEGLRKQQTLEVNHKRELANLDKQIDQTIAALALGDLKQDEVLRQQFAQRQELQKSQREETAKLNKELRDKDLEQFLKDEAARAQLAIDTAQTPEQELEARQQFLDAKFEMDLEAAQGNAEALLEVYAKNQFDQDKLDEAVFNNKVARIQQFSTLFQGVVGKNTLAAKIAAEVSAKLDAAQQLRNNVLIIQEQVKSIVSQGKLVFPLNIGAIFATLSALAAGIAAAKSLTSMPKGFAEGGVFESDGKGSVLPGYSRTDNTNARLRSGEAVIVAEAVRNPFALATLSAINVAHGGRALAPGFAMASGGIASGSYVGGISDSISAQFDMTNAMIAGLSAVNIITDVRDVTSAQQRSNAVVNNATI
ncbi:MAG: hypothetical protein K0S09_20 [Sphingobacteriaceae bacterium]|jgi:hypothetical protein|nr:hypothetical protein [Sphingobacteriaceae bacterium]